MNSEDSEVQNNNPEQADLESAGDDVLDHGAGVDQALEDGFDAKPEAAPQKTDSQRVIDAEQEALRARAEMENFRKRMQRDSEQQLKYANMPLVRDLLDVWDNLQRALDAANADDDATKSLREGVGMVSQQMTDALAKYGCKRIEALGKEFDPNVHEAISQMPSEEYEKGVVMNEVAVGYLLHDRVVRPSHVIVSTGSPA